MVTSTGVRASPSEHEFSPSRRRLCCLDLVFIALQYCIKVQNPGKWFTWNICTLYIGIHIKYWLLIIFLPSTTAAVTLIRRRKSLGSIANCYRSSLGSWRTAATGSPCDLGDLELWTATCPHWSCLIWSVGTKEVKWSEDKCYLLSLEMCWTTRADWISLPGVSCPSFLPFYIENHFQWEGFLPSMLTKPPKNYLR